MFNTAGPATAGCKLPAQVELSVTDQREGVVHAAEPSALPACLPARVVERTCAGALQTAVMECGDFKGPCFDQPQTTDPQRPLAAFLPLTGRTHRRHPGSQPRLRHRQPTGILNADHQSITNSIDVDVSSPLPSRTTSSVTSHRAPLLQIPLGQPNHREPPGKLVHRHQRPSAARRFAVPLLGTVHAASRGRVLVRPTTRQADPGARGCPACSDPTSPYSCPRPRVRQNQNFSSRKRVAQTTTSDEFWSLATVMLFGVPTLANTSCASLCRPWYVSESSFSQAVPLEHWEALFSPLPACLSSSQQLQGRQQQIDHLKPKPWTHHRCRRGPLSRSLSFLQVPGASTLTSGARTEEHAHGGKRRPGLCQAG